MVVLYLSITPLHGCNSGSGWALGVRAHYVFNFFGDLHGVVTYPATGRVSTRWPDLNQAITTAG